MVNKKNIKVIILIVFIIALLILGMVKIFKSKKIDNSNNKAIYDNTIANINNSDNSDEIKTESKSRTIVDDKYLKIESKNYRFNNDTILFDITNKTNKDFMISFERTSLNMGMTTPTNFIKLKANEKLEQCEIHFSLISDDIGMGSNDVTQVQSDFYVYELKGDQYDDILIQPDYFEENNIEPFLIYKKLKLQESDNYLLPEIETTDGAADIINDKNVEFRLVKQACRHNGTDSYYDSHYIKFYLKNNYNDKDLKFNLKRISINGKESESIEEEIISSNGGYKFITNSFGLTMPVLEDLQSEEEIKTLEISYVISNADDETDILYNENITIQLVHGNEYSLRDF